MFKGLLNLLGVSDAVDSIKFLQHKTPQRGYYNRYTGKSKTFKKNKRRGL